MANSAFQEKMDKAIMVFYRGVAAKLGGAGELWFTVGDGELVLEWTPRHTKQPGDGWRVWRSQVSIEHLMQDTEQMSSLIAGRIRQAFERDELERRRRETGETGKVGK